MRIAGKNKILLVILAIILLAVIVVLILINNRGDGVSSYQECADRYPVNVSNTNPPECVDPNTGKTYSQALPL